MAHAMLPLPSVSGTPWGYSKQGTDVLLVFGAVLI